MYEGGKQAKMAGAISCGDMTVEAAVVKLMFLLGQFDGDVDKVVRHFQTPLAGEATWAR
ncbi:glutamyl-tRNA(Gln) amidotransferase subunit D [compost metagenome]